MRKEVAAISAVIFGGCHPQVGFYSQGQKVAYLHVGACKTYERAPVSGKRYFTYKRGTKDLPALRKILPAGFKEEACT